MVGTPCFAFPPVGSDEDLVIDLLQKQRVIVHPGHFYDFPKDGFLVVSLVTSTEVFQEGVSRLLHFLKETRELSQK